eukprot:SRR837773.12789.p1 GENE.SRR837773.12789~~SRR837773.12789.p1  ORF type:complete len:207 (+),score=8.91 SRR837773.12789:93-623(+)
MIEKPGPARLVDLASDREPKRDSVDASTEGRSESSASAPTSPSSPRNITASPFSAEGQDEDDAPPQPTELRRFSSVPTARDRHQTILEHIVNLDEENSKLRNDQDRLRCENKQLLERLERLERAHKECSEERSQLSSDLTFMRNLFANQAHQLRLLQEQQESPYTYLKSYLGGGSS